jgi:hypothetical protein
MIDGNLNITGYYVTHGKVGNKFLGNDQNYIRKENKRPDKGDIHEGVKYFDVLD